MPDYTESYRLRTHPAAPSLALRQTNRDDFELLVVEQRQLQMRTGQGILRYAFGLLVVGLIGFGAGALSAADRTQEFVEGLRQREYFDTALEYLESLRESPLTDPAFREIIDYEIGVTLMAGAHLLPPDQWQQQLDDARNRLAKFASEHPEHPLATTASTHLANLLIDAGRRKLEQAEALAAADPRKKQFREEARPLFQESQKVLAKVDEKLLARHRQFKNVDPNDVKRIAERNQIRTDIMQTRLALATMVYDIARTYEPGSDEYKANLTAAAKQFGEYYQKYSRWLGGYYARVDEARCYKDLGDYDAAMKILQELIRQPESDETFRKLRTSAVELAVEISALPQVKKYTEAIELYRDWEKNIARRNQATEDALAIKFFAGDAALNYARGLNPKQPEESKRREEHLLLAKDLLKFVARYPGEHRAKARLLLTDPLLGGGEIVVEPPKNYDEARDRAKLAWDRMQSQDLNPQELAQLRAEALQNFRFALDHAPKNVKPEDLNVIRYCLAYLYWATEEYYDAALLGEFLARRYPDRPEAQPGASIALSSYAKLFSEVLPDDNRQFETDRINGIGEYIGQRWPKSPPADEAWLMLIRVAVANRDVAKAMEYLERVSADSPRRGETELMTGQALWNAYLEAARLAEEDRPSKDQMNKMFAQARKVLEDGIGRVRKSVDEGGQVSYPLTAAVLSLAQICLDAGQPDQAIQWLDDPKIGPHTLTVAENPIAAQGNFRVETLKAALRAYVAAQQLDKAESTMNLLEKVAGNANLTRIYLSLGRQLEESLKRIRDQGSQEEAAKVAQGFTAFLSRLSTRPLSETNFNTLNWVAEMFMSLGASLDSGKGAPPAEAIAYYEKAAETYQRIIKACRENSNFAPMPTATYSIQIRLARCLRRMGKYGQDMETLVAILKEQNNMIDAQREAALTYEVWAEKKPEFYVMAIRGGHPTVQSDGKPAYLVWGWGGIARKVQYSQTYQDIFYEARHHLALCRFKYALTKQGQERTELLKQAENDILIIARLRPDMGGKTWYNQFDALLKDIQKQLGTRAAGLRVIEEKSSNKTR